MHENDSLLDMIDQKFTTDETWAMQDALLRRVQEVDEAITFAQIVFGPDGSYVLALVPGYGHSAGWHYGPVRPTRDAAIASFCKGGSERIEPTLPQLTRGAR